MSLLNKNGQWWLSITLISISILSLSTTIMWNETKKENRELQVQLKNLTSQRQINDSLTIDSLNRVVDSIQTDLFTSQTINGKYEMGLHFLLERKPNEYLVIKNYIDNLE
jgi:hypothetical protein